MTDIPGILALSIPLVAIVIGGMIVILRVLMRHRERMAMIEMGLHPDYPPPEEGILDPGEVSQAPRGQVKALRSPAGLKASGPGEK